MDKAFALEVLGGGLHAFQLQDGSSDWYCFTLSVARVLSVTTRAVAQSVSRHASADEAASVLCATRSSHPDLFGRLLATYETVKRQLDGAVESLNSRKGDKFSLYPLPLVANLLSGSGRASSSSSLQPTLQAVQTFLLRSKAPEIKAGAAGAGAGAGSGSGSGSRGLGLLPDLGDEESKEPAAAGQEIKVKIEPHLRPSRRSALPVSSFAEGGIPVIDLTDPATLAALEAGEQEGSSTAPSAAASVSDLEQTLSSLVDNFALWQPRQEEYSLLREYGLRADEVAESPRLQEQCQRFSEYRQEIWNWHRDPAQVTPRTVGNNIRVFLLFGGFVCHTTKRHRLKPSTFDMSVFGSPHIEDYVMDFLHYLHGSRGLMFSSIANYLNSLTVLAKFYFVDNPLADVSFSVERVDSQFVLAGLRRVRAQTNAKAKGEAVQKPLHSQWLSWPECQRVRRACQTAYEAAAAGSSKKNSKALRLLKSLVCLGFYTIAPPPRCSIVRLLQWRTTLVKKRTDPSRYVIDLLSNSEAPASQHKTVKFYRRAVLPLPKSMTPYLDKLREKRTSDWVFVNSRGEPYTTTAWTHFVKSAFAKHGVGDKKAAPSPSLARSIFVTWLNGVPYDTRDSQFLNEVKLSAAEYQTHSLAIANAHYDKDSASEAKLRTLVDFCDAYAQWLPASAGGNDGKSSLASASGSASSRLTDNIDSDEDEDMSPAPALEAEVAVVASFLPSDLEVKEAKQAAILGSAAAGSAAESKEAKKAPPLPPPATEVKRPSTRRKGRRSSSSWRDSDSSDSSSSSSDSEPESSDGGDEGGGENEDHQPAVQDKTEYLPDRIIAKKTVAWRDFYLIHWLGYTAAERTWEPAAFFDEYCTKQTHDYEESRRPLRIVSRKARPGESKEEKSLFFEVQWQGRPASESSMEREGMMREEFSELVEAWEEKQKSPQSLRKHARSASSAAAADGERPAKRLRGQGQGAVVAESCSSRSSSDS